MMSAIRGDWIDPEIGESLRGFPDFEFSVDNIPAMRSGMMFEPQCAPDIKRVELTTENGGIALSVLRLVESAAEPPVLYWMHGGGMVIGNRHMDDGRLIEWCRWLGCVCVSVEYRLAPESPYPTPLDDCEAGLRFIVEHAHDLEINPQRVGIGGRTRAELRWSSNCSSKPPTPAKRCTHMAFHRTLSKCSRWLASPSTPACSPARQKRWLRFRAFLKVQPGGSAMDEVRKTAGQAAHALGLSQGSRSEVETQGSSDRFLLTFCCRRTVG